MSAFGDPPYESRIEIVLGSSSPDLLSIPFEAFNSIVLAANAKIISSRRFPNCLACLLSESSLFIFSDRLVMLTCGKSNVLNSVEQFIIDIPQAKWRFFSAEQRYSPDMNIRSDQFKKAVNLIVSKVPLTGTDDWSSEQCSERFVRYSLPHENSRALFMAGEHEIPCQPNAIKEKAAMLGFSADNIDEFSFTPSGYSLNGWKPEGIITIHYTPRRYLSVELEAKEDDLGKIQDLFIQLVPDAKIRNLRTGYSNGCS